MAHSTHSYSRLINSAAIFAFAFTILAFVLGIYEIYLFLQELGNSKNALLVILSVFLGLAAILNFMIFPWIFFRKFKSWLMPAQDLPGFLSFLLSCCFFYVTAPYIVVKYGWQLGIKLQNQQRPVLGFRKWNPSE